MRIICNIVELLRLEGLPGGLRILAGRFRARALHSCSLAADLARAFWRWSSFYRQSRRSGRRLVCISLIEHMGDIVACQPVASFARAQEAGALIIWCLKRNYAGLVAAFPEIDGVITVGCLSSWIALRKWGRFDRVIDLHINGRTCLTCGVPLLKEEGERCVTMENYYNHGSLLQVFCLSAGLPVLNDRPELAIPDDVARSADRLGEAVPTVVMHCCSNEACRDWSNEHWNGLIDALHERYGVKVVEIGAKSPLERPDSAAYRNRCGQCSLLQSAELIRRSLLFIGIDSGPAHLANAVGTPGVIMLGDYLAFRNYTPYTGPYADGSGATLLRSQGEASLIPLAEVLEAAAARLAATASQTQLEQEK